MGNVWPTCRVEMMAHVGPGSKFDCTTSQSKNDLRVKDVEGKAWFKTKLNCVNRVSFMAFGVFVVGV